MCIFLNGALLTVCTWPLAVLLWQQPLETDVIRVAVDGGFVGTGLDLFRFLWGEWTGSALCDVHLQLQQDLQGIPQLCLTAKTETLERGLTSKWTFFSKHFQQTIWRSQQTVFKMRQWQLLAIQPYYYPLLKIVLMVNDISVEDDDKDAEMWFTCTWWRKRGCYSPWAAEEKVTNLQPDPGWHGNLILKNKYIEDMQTYSGMTFL